MNTAMTSHATARAHAPAIGRKAPVLRFFGVVGRPQTYRSVGYLLLGLVLATAWAAVLVSALSVSLSMLAVALLGIPMLLGTWYIMRALANVERGLVNVLLGADLRGAPMATTHQGNLWLRLTAMSRERSRWRELAYLFVRIPVGIATFTTTVVALAVPLALVWAPFHARQADDFGDWFWSSELQDVSSSPAFWGLVPLGLGLLVVSLHLLNRLAARCGQWTTRWLDVDRPTTGPALA